MMLSEKFDLESFSNWIEEFFPDFKSDVRKVEIPVSFSDAKSITTLGESNLGVRVFVIETSKDPSGRKVGLAKDSFNLIKNYGTPHALIAYYSEKGENWRFSLLTSTPSWNESKIITKLSNPKRHSYVLGPNAKVNTPTKFLINKGKVLDFNDLKSRFSLEVVNKEFYKEISESFTKLVGGTRGEGRNKNTYESLLKLPSTNDHSQTSIEFAVRLVGRVIFCWFLKEKMSESGSSLMPKELLSLDAISNNSDYYHKIMEPIFFEILNKPIKSRRDDFSSKTFSQIPYLNGGLFSPHDDDFFSYSEGKQAQFHNTVVVPDDWFKEFFGILETYNFTIDENTSIDEDLSIDPEMLGRIFENLLAEINPETGESARKSTGSYYTPRVIVDYMVDESLLLYLKQKTDMGEEKLRAIISYDLSDDSSYPLSENEKEDLVDAIEKVKILDPACGSGAYPIGALQKIVFILQQTDPDGQTWFHKQIQNTSPEIKRVMEREFSHKNFDYIRKLGIIRENIYGIDIQPIATEISRLRCFLTLVVDERIDDTQENRGIEPLPNLDFKFVTANSLIGLPTSDKRNQMGLFEDTEGINELREIRDMFFNASGTEREMLKLKFMQSQKNMLQRLISENRRGHADLTTMLTTWDPFSHNASSWFDPEWMFGIKDGFDIVIANPPYINIYSVDSKYKDAYRKRYSSAAKKYDIYVLFIEFGLSLLRTDGVLEFITSNKYFSQPYGEKIRETILNNEIIEILNFRTNIFEASVDTAIITVKKNASKKIGFLYFEFNSPDLSQINTAKRTLIPFKIINNLQGKTFRFSLNQEKIEIIKRIDSQSIKLKDICYINYGCRLVSKDGSKKKKDYIFESRNRDNLEKFIEGQDIRKYLIKNSRWLDYRPTEHYLSLFKELFTSQKLVAKDVVGKDGIRIALDSYGYFDDHTVINAVNWSNLECADYVKKEITTERVERSKKYSLKYLLGILNSKLVNFYFYELYDIDLHFYPNTLQNMPIPDNPSIKKDRIEELVDLIILKCERDDVTASQAELDKIIYEIYGLTTEEVRIVESKND